MGREGNTSDNGAAFREIHDAFRPKIRRYLSRLISEDEADDLTQEVFIKVSRSLPNFKGESSLSTWIYTIATNTAMDKLRSPVSRHENIAETYDENVLGEDYAGVKNAPLSADQQLIREQMNKCIREVVDTLPPDYRTVIALSEMSELKNREIADILGISLDAVKIRLHRARARLKKALEERCDFYRNSQNEFSCEPKVESIRFKNKS